MATPIEFVEKQWQDWQEKNPAEQFEHIDEDNMKEVLIKDLTYASQMDVREYTLYQKWCEVKERYPVHEVSTLFGEETQMVYPEQEEMINDVKSKFWMPQEPDDFEKLKPQIQEKFPELLKAWYDYKASIKIMDAVVKCLI